MGDPHGACSVTELPIQNLDRIDLMGRRKDGGVDLVIVVSGPLLDIAAHLHGVGRKIAAYIHAISTPEFAEEFPRGDAPRRILLVTEHTIDPAVIALVDSLRRAAMDAGAALDIVDPTYFSKS